MFILSCAVKQNQPQERRGTRCRSRSGRDDRKMPPAGLKHVASISIPSGSALKHDVTSLPLKPPSLTEFPYLATPDMIAIPSQGLKEQPYPHAVSQKSSGSFQGGSESCDHVTLQRAPFHIIYKQDSLFDPIIIASLFLYLYFKSFQWLLFNYWSKNDLITRLIVRLD